MLKIQYRDGSAAPVELVAPGKTIGQGAANDIVIDKDGVNGFHADIQVEGDVVSIIDINTTIGTMVNGEKISGRTTLRAGDIVSVQGVELEIVEEDASGGGKTLVLSGTALMELGTGTCHWSPIQDQRRVRSSLLWSDSRLAERSIAIYLFLNRACPANMRSYTLSAMTLSSGI